MSQTAIETPVDLTEVINNIITEDDEPVDNIFSAKQQRLLVAALYSGWTPPPAEEVAPGEPPTPRKFLADANVGIFSSPHQPPLVPDMFLSLDVEPHADWFAKQHRSYFIWEFDKAPEVVVEIVSNRVGKELSEKPLRYARMDVTYYVVYDPQQLLSDDVLRVHERGFGKRYRRREDFNLPEVGLSLTLWEGVFEGRHDTWLRWCDREGSLISTADEQAAQAREQAAQAEARAARLAAKLRELGVDPEQV